MKRKILSIMFALVLAISLTLVPLTPAMANDVASSTMYFEGTLIDAGGGVYTGIIPMTEGEYYVIGGPGEDIWDDGGFDVYAEEGGNAYVQGLGSWTIGSDHDAYSESGPWGSWYDPDCTDWDKYSLELTGTHWYLRYTPTGESPMSGIMIWNGDGTGYAAETDLGTQDGGHDGSAAHGGGAQAWDWDCGWGVEVVPLQYLGFNVVVTSTSNNGYHVTLTPAPYEGTTGFVTGGGWIDSPPGAHQAPAFWEPVWEQGFEVNTDGWFGATRVSSGTNGITSSSGDWHAEIYVDADTDYTRWGGYSSNFPPGGYITSLDIYLDVGASFANDSRFDFSSAISNPDGDHRRDFIFNGGFYNDDGGPGAGQNRFVFSASNNAPGWPKNPERDPIAITSSGWYTFQHWFRDDGSGVLAVNLSIFDSVGNLVHKWTLSDPTDVIGSTVGGNRYGWFVYSLSPFMAIDNSFRAETPTGKASFGFVARYKKGASAPTGQTEFIFQAAGLNFHSSSYDWLVVNQAGSNAQFKGVGTINGVGSYRFMLWAGDGAPDTFRIKIWEEDELDVENVVYDNGMNQPISGGNIVVHNK